MGFRFRKGIRLVPGLRLNLTKRGVSSVSVGGRGMSLNIGRKGLKRTIGVPGSGLSYSTDTPYKSASGGISPGAMAGWIIFAALLIVYFLYQ